MKQNANKNAAAFWRETTKKIQKSPIDNIGQVSLVIMPPLKKKGCKKPFSPPLYPPSPIWPLDPTMPTVRKGSPWAVYWHIGWRIPSPPSCLAGRRGVKAYPKRLRKCFAKFAQIYDLMCVSRKLCTILWFSHNASGRFHTTSCKRSTVVHLLK